MRKYSVSVAMAAYNGEKYIKEQIDSILKQLTQNDELIISLDPSTDSTEMIIKNYNDDRIHLISGPGKGFIWNFENAIKHCSKHIIFLSDQDDVWTEDKVDSVVNCFLETNATLVMHDCKVVDEHLDVIRPSFFAWRKSRVGILSTLIKNPYIGCCLAFKKELKEMILPFYKHVPTHDHYIGLAAEVKGKSVLLHKPLLLYRRHGSNTSPTATEHLSLLGMIEWRLRILLSYFYLLKKRKIK